MSIKYLTSNCLKQAFSLYLLGYGQLSKGVVNMAVSKPSNQT